jgi:hypothetical protein
LIHITLNRTDTGALEMQYIEDDLSSFSASK